MDTIFKALILLFYCHLRNNSPATTDTILYVTCPCPVTGESASEAAMVVITVPVGCSSSIVHVTPAGLGASQTGVSSFTGSTYRLFNCMTKGFLMVVA